MCVCVSDMKNLPVLRQFSLLLTEKCLVHVQVQRPPTPQPPPVPFCLKEIEQVSVVELCFICLSPQMFFIITLDCLLYKVG